MSGCAPCGSGGLALSPPFRVPQPPGAFASCNIRFQALAGQGQLVAAASPGVAIGRFGWAYDDGTVGNARLTARDRLGVVLPYQWPQMRSWQAVYWDKTAKAWFIRPGLPVTLMVAGEVFVRFDGGSLAGNQVYTDPTTGLAYSGVSLGFEATPFVVARGNAAGCTAPISTWSQFSP